MVSRCTLVLISTAVVALVAAAILMNKYDSYTCCPQYQTNLTYSNTASTATTLTTIHSQGLTHWRYGGTNYTQVTDGSTRQVSTMMFDQAVQMLVEASCQYEQTVAQYYFQQDPTCNRARTDTPFCVVDPQAPAKCHSLATVRSLWRWFIGVVLLAVIAFFGAVASALSQQRHTTV